MGTLGQCRRTGIHQVDCRSPQPAGHRYHHLRLPLHLGGNLRTARKATPRNDWQILHPRRTHLRLAGRNRILRPNSILLHPSPRKGHCHRSHVIHTHVHHPLYREPRATHRRLATRRQGFQHHHPGRNHPIRRHRLAPHHVRLRRLPGT